MKTEVVVFFLSTIFWNAAFAQNMLAAITAADAAQLCSDVISTRKINPGEASEDASKANATEFAVTWLLDDGKPPMFCVVNRESRKIISMTINGRTLAGPMLIDMEQTAALIRDTRSGNYGKFVAMAKASITSQLKDPDSAQFKSLFISGKTAPVLCGELNGKNSYGGYVGYRRFYSTGKPLLNGIETDKDNYVFQNMWPNMCGEKIAEVNP